MFIIFKYAVTRLLLKQFVHVNSKKYVRKCLHHTQCVPIESFFQKLLHNHPKWHKHSKYKPRNKNGRKKLLK